MEAINELRRLARERRDKLLAKVYAEYEQTLNRISVLEGDLTATDNLRRKPIATSILSALPTEGEFTTIEVMQRLEVREPSRQWLMRTVAGTILRLRRKGIVRLVRPGKSYAGSKGAHPAVYALADSAVKSVPFAEVQFPDVLYSVLHGKALTLPELLAALRDSGYQSSFRGKNLNYRAQRTMRADTRFKRVGEKWTC